MTQRSHHVFFSYARADNAADNNHFIKRFHDLLCREHDAVTGRELKTFFDTEAIDSGERWKTRLGQGLRDSRLFVAFLSNNYLKSEVCRWEWEHYLLTEHTAARGEDGVVPLYFIPIDELGKDAEAQLAEWIEEIKQRNLGAYCQLQPWYKAGRERAQELDAAERADALRQVDVGSEDDLPLQERIRRLNLRICRRLDRIQLAEQVIGNVVRPYRHFVGRHQQLRELHEALTVDQTQLLATVHSPGGFGKSALARQYAIAYADFYAAGGVWELKCTNLTHLGDALRQLEQYNALTKHGFSLEEDRDKTSDQQAASALAQLKRITHDRRDTVNQQLRDLEQRHTPEDQLEVRENSRCLLILDNVDETAMLAADQLNLIPAEDWLSVIVTTRLSPDSFGAVTSLKSIEVPPLSLAEGTELLRTFMPDETFPDQEEAKAAEELVKVLDGYTIALELIGAFVHTNWKAGALLSKYLRTLETKGLAATDQLAGKKGIEDKIAYQHRQIALIVNDSLTSLRKQLAEEYGEEMANAAQEIIEIASLLQPDTIPAPWLEAMLKQAHPDLEETDEGLEPWGIILQALLQLNLLSPAERQGDEDENAPDVLRIHRVTAAHIAKQLSAEGAWHWQQIESYVDRLLAWLEQEVSLSTLSDRERHERWLFFQLEFPYFRAAVDVAGAKELPPRERIYRMIWRTLRHLDWERANSQVFGTVVIRPYRQFVGRHRQLRELHEALTVDQTSILAIVHSPGGLGKSALARQYAFAYADFYAAGGVWELKCANLSHLGDALRQLEHQEELKKHGFSLEEVRDNTPDQQATSALVQLKHITYDRRTAINRRLFDLEGRPATEDRLEVRANSRCLLILDDIDDTALLAADRLRLIPAEDWLSVIVTTRISRYNFGTATGLKSIDVPPLNQNEGMELLRSLVPAIKISGMENAAASQIITLAEGNPAALEVIGTFVHANWPAGARLQKLIPRLAEQGLSFVEKMAVRREVSYRLPYRFSLDRQDSK